MNEQFKAQITYKAREFATAYTNRHFPNEPAFAFGNEGWAKFVDALVELAGALAAPGAGTTGAIKLQVLELDFKQATELLDMYGGEPGVIGLCIGDGHSGHGIYAHYVELPEEGAEFLGVADDEAAPVAQLSEPLTWNQKMAGVKAMLGCTDGELECIGEKNLDTYCEEVERVYRVLCAAPTTPKDAS